MLVFLVTSPGSSPMWREAMLMRRVAVSLPSGSCVRVCSRFFQNFFAVLSRLSPARNVMNFSPHVVRIIGAWCPSLFNFC